jgi:ATP-binding cassette, subfamily B, bacterial
MSNPQTSNYVFAWQYLKTEKKAFILALAFILVNAGLQTLTPVAIEYLINNAIKVPNYPLLWQVIAGMCLLFLIEGFIFRYQVITVGYAAQRIMYKIRTNLFAHIQNLKSDFFNKNQSGDLISRINSDTTLLDNFLGQYIFAFTSSFFVFVAFGLYLLWLNPLLALLAYFAVFLTVAISLALKSIVERTNKVGLESNGELKSYLADNLNNYQVIQAYNIHNKLAGEFQKFNSENQKTNFRSRIFTNIFASIYNLTGNLALLLILVAVFYFKIGSTSLGIGALVAFVYAVIKFFQPMRELGSVFSSLAEAVAALNRVREILGEPVSDLFKLNGENLKVNSEKLVSNKISKAEAGNSPREGWQAKPDGVFQSDVNQNILAASKNSKDNIAIQLSNVSFSYITDSKVFDSISFPVPTNSKFAIIGPTGEGKSTIAKLMSGLLSPDSGTIKVFGKELKDWPQNDFYNTIGFILQDPFLFSGTVASNIVYGNPRYEKFNIENLKVKSEELVTKKNSKAEVIKLPFDKGLAAQADWDSKGDKTKTAKTESTLTDLLLQTLIADIKAHELESIIPHLEDFLQTEVNNNSQNISQGQKQIINFVRVLLREPKILILDEATANLDTITEKYLQQALGKLTNKVTQIVIAHRQNTISDADYIMQVGGGRVSVEKRV